MDHNYTYYANIDKDDVILILGATKGDFMTERASEIIAKNAFIVNVEPTLDGIGAMSKLITQYLPNNACIVSSAISNFNGITTMDIRDNLITSTLEDRPETNERWPMRLLYKSKVPTMTFDMLLEIVGKVDKVFCDIEGSELDVFESSNKLNTIPYYAIAAYHMRDGEPTWKKLTEIFNGFDIIVDGEPSIHKHEVVFFARRKD